eukprot:7346174-Prymnesium_polylepis.1
MSSAAPTPWVQCSPALYRMTSASTLLDLILSALPLDSDLATGISIWICAIRHFASRVRFNSAVLGVGVGRHGLSRRSRRGLTIGFTARHRASTYRCTTIWLVGMRVLETPLGVWRWP